MKLCCSGLANVAANCHEPFASLTSAGAQWRHRPGSCAAGSQAAWCDAQSSSRVHSNEYCVLRLQTSPHAPVLCGERATACCAGYAARLTRLKLPGPETEDGAVVPLPAPALAQGPPPSETSNSSSVRRPQPVRVLAKHDFDVLAPSPSEPLPAGGTLQTSAGSAFSALHPSPSLPAR